MGDPGAVTRKGDEKSGQLVKHRLLTLSYGFQFTEKESRNGRYLAVSGKASAPGVLSREVGTKFFGVKSRATSLGSIRGRD